MKQRRRTDVLVSPDRALAAIEREEREARLELAALEVEQRVALVLDSLRASAVELVASEKGQAQ